MSLLTETSLPNYPLELRVFSPELRLACFIGGLREDICLDVMAMKPINLLEAYELAKVYEE